MTLGASAGDASVGELGLLAGVAILLALALFTTSRRTLRLRRSRPMVVLISDGWLAVGIGILLGPGGVGFIGADRLQDQLTPALQAAMGWVGLMVGLQARREVLRGLPGWVWRIVACDGALVALLFGSMTVLGVWAWLGYWDWAGVWWGGAVLTCAAAGWALETRSIVGIDSPQHLESARFGVRAGGTLSALVWILLFGLLLGVAPRRLDGAIQLDFGRGAAIVVACACAATLIAVIGRFALRIAGKAPDARLAIFLGMVALSAGFASQLGVPALTVAALTGIVLANLSDAGVREFERFILRADLVVATLVALLAGILMSTHIGVRELALGCGIAGLRLLFKPWVLRRGLPRDVQAGPLSIAPVRQSMIALAMALSALLIEPSPMMGRVLAIVVIAGVVCAVLPALLSWSDQRARTSVAKGAGAKGVVA